MKIGLITCGNIWFSPYIKYYTQILESYNISYEIVSWNRDGSDNKQGVQYNDFLNSVSFRCTKLWKYLTYAQFVKRTIIKQGYDKLIIFGPQLAILIASFLAKNYRGKYIFDYRDISIEQYKILQPSFKSVLESSYLNVISSPGFLQHLPKGYEYIISHNFDYELCKSQLENSQHLETSKPSIEVLTIGAIRDFSSNSEVIRALSNKNDIHISFIGKGCVAAQLQNYAVSIGCNNIMFWGYYPKEKEKEYINKCTFLNIFYPRIKSHSSALSNRFYNSLIYKRPMIVTSDSTQGDYVEKYNLGLSIDNCDNLALKLREWLQENDFNSFSKRCDILLQMFIKEQELFISTVIKFVTENL